MKEKNTSKDIMSLSVKFHNGQVIIKLLYVRECNNIQENYSEIPVPDVGKAYPQLRHIIMETEPVEPGVPITFLVGRYVLRAYKVREQIEGPENASFAQHLDLGWAIFGESCLDAAVANDADSEVRPETSVSSRHCNHMALAVINSTGSQTGENFSEQSLDCFKLLEDYRMGAKGGWKQFSLQPNTGTLQSASHVILNNNNNNNNNNDKTLFIQVNFFIKNEFAAINQGPVKLMYLRYS